MGRAKKEKCETLNVGEKVFGRLLSSVIPNVIRHEMTRSPAFPPPWQGTLPNLDLMEKHGGKHLLIYVCLKDVELFSHASWKHLFGSG